MNYKTDIEIAQEHTPEFIMNIASRAHIDEKYVEQYVQNAGHCESYKRRFSIAHTAEYC